MKKIALILLSLFLLTACAKEESAGDAVMLERSRTPVTAEAPMEAPMTEIMNFRTSDGLDMISENRIIRTYEEFRQYDADYTILENPFFIDELSLTKLQKVDEAYFERQGFVAVILVESSGSNSVVGENLVIKDNMAEAFINRTEAEIGTMDIATRHVLFTVSQEELKNVDEVKVTSSLK